MRRKLDNLTFIVDDDFTSSFSVEDYTFHPQRRFTQGSRVVVTGNRILNENRQHKQNAYVEYGGAQQDSILFMGGLEGNRYRPRKRRFLDDILVLGSILTARNWGLYSRRNNTQYPVVSRNRLEYISKNASECKQHLDIAINKIKDSAWQRQFDNGFHLRALLNHANIINAESRFLSMVVVWEWLYPHLKNPNGATSSDESNNLLNIFAYILKQYWPSRLNATLENNNIFHVLRNQLAHSGKLPIDRSYAEDWMTQILWDGNGTAGGINDYLRFFDRLTQIVVLKTIGIDGEENLRVFNFPEQLDSFLSTGKI
ncbi:MAG: hypothetical protein HYT27_02025 [Parcubacteria group bacterium]|nr:hypothetical protein [Parcubacteria group bacterium]